MQIHAHLTLAIFQLRTMVIIFWTLDLFKSILQDLCFSLICNSVNCTGYIFDLVQSVMGHFAIHACFCCCCFGRHDSGREAGAWGEINTRI